MAGASNAMSPLDVVAQLNLRPEIIAVIFLVNAA
jgi:hypothetical protein